MAIPDRQREPAKALHIIPDLGPVFSTLSAGVRDTLVNVAHVHHLLRVLRLEFPGRDRRVQAGMDDERVEFRDFKYQGTAEEEGVVR